ncbi:hypothetical protein [Streptosporangium sp. CA-115845]|uniref:hypothetical protein n=1 Tax=Streptosporangium sp. CA-115845 TaxID=3240071 RepID=UPI003D8C53F9
MNERDDEKGAAVNLPTDGFLTPDMEASLEINCNLIFELVQVRSRLAVLTEGTDESVWAEAEATVARVLGPLLD